MGRATAISFGREAMRVAIVARTEAALAAVADEVKAAGAAEVIAITADACSSAEVQRFVGQVEAADGGLDVLVNTIGLCEVVPDGILAADDEHWDRAYQSVLMAAVYACRAALPGMLARGDGRIVNVAAMSTKHYLPMIAHYSAPKIALAHFTKNLAKEFGARGVRSNAVMPGMIESEGVAARKRQRMAERGWTDEEFFTNVNERYDHCTYANRLGRPEEIADAITWLVSDRASYVNGAWLPVDGGSTFA
jgi:3-oxoacyl-[acyl-carrier protein] reductase